RPVGPRPSAATARRWPHSSTPSGSRRRRPCSPRAPSPRPAPRVRTGPVSAGEAAALADGVGEFVAVRGVPVDRPGHGPAHARVGLLGDEVAAALELLQAGEGVVDHRRVDVARSGGAGNGGEAEADLAGLEAGLELDAGLGGQEVDVALAVDLAVAPEPAAGVVVLHVDDGQDVLGADRQPVVPGRGGLEVDGLGGHRVDQARTRRGVDGAHRGLQGGGVDAVLEVDVDAVESVFVHQGQDGVGEGVRAGGVVDGDVALLAADGDDHLAALGLDGGDVGLELGLGVVQDRVEREVDGADGTGDGVGEGHGDDVVLVGDLGEAQEGGAVVEVVPVAGEGRGAAAGGGIGGRVRRLLGGRVDGALAVAGAEGLPHAPFAGGARLFAGGPPFGAVLVAVVADQVAADVDRAGPPGVAFA